MNRKFRLTTATDFKRVRRLGKSYAHPLVVLVALPNELGKTRFAVAAGRSVGGAVQRNRAKRLLREALRPWLSALGRGWDAILIARRPLAEATLHDLSPAIDQVLRQAHLIDPSYDRQDPPL